MVGKAGDKGQIVAESGDRPRETLKNKAFAGPVPDCSMGLFLICPLSQRPLRSCSPRLNCRLQLALSAANDWLCCGDIPPDTQDACKGRKACTVCHKPELRRSLPQHGSQGRPGKKREARHTELYSRRSTPSGLPRAKRDRRSHSVCRPLCRTRTREWTETSPLFVLPQDTRSRPLTCTISGSRL